MFEDDEKPIRYHLTEKFVLDFGDRVFLDKLETATLEWARLCDVPEDKKTPETLQPFVREMAITQGGEAWRAMTERGELLCVFSVYEFAKELSRKKTSPILLTDQYFLGFARECLGVY
jgi:hypothetical protein